MRPEIEEAAVWLAQAQLDLDTARDLQSGRPYAACFYAQQAAEKAVKALYVANGVEFRYVYSVHQLISDVGEAFPSVQRFQDEGATLDEYYISTRCPQPRLWGPKPPGARYSGRHSQQAIQMAERILAECQSVYGSLAAQAAVDGTAQD